MPSKSPKQANYFAMMAPSPKKAKKAGIIGAKMKPASKAKARREQSKGKK